MWNKYELHIIDWNELLWNGIHRNQSIKVWLNSMEMKQHEISVNEMNKLNELRISSGFYINGVLWMEIKWIKWNETIRNWLKAKGK